MLTVDSSSQKINISTSTAYYHDHLNLLWAEVKRSRIYERVIFHGISCQCCKRIPNPVLDIGNKKKEKKSKESKKEVHRI